MAVVYIDDYGKLYIGGRTIKFVNWKNKKRYFPIEQVDSITVTTKITFTSGSIKELLHRRIFVHFISQRYGYLGSIIPSRFGTGINLVKQVEHYKNKLLRAEIANEIVNSIISNMNAFLRKYNLKIEEQRREYTNNIDKIRGYEAQAWVSFYSKLRNLIKNFVFNRRVFYPPTDEINALISFINSLLYSTTITNIYTSNLNPAISYLHEPSTRDFSLALDIADIFKPLITYPILLRLTNKSMINKNDFDDIEGAVFLKKEALDKVVSLFIEKINKPFYCKHFKRSISFNTLIKYQVSQLRSSILNNEKFVGFKMRKCM